MSLSKSATLGAASTVLILLATSYATAQQDRFLGRSWLWLERGYSIAVTRSGRINSSDTTTPFSGRLADGGPGGSDIGIFMEGGTCYYRLNFTKRYDKASWRRVPPGSSSPEGYEERCPSVITWELAARDD